MKTSHSKLKPTTVEDYIARMVRLQDFVSQNIDADALSPDDLARVAAMSKHHLHRVFRAMFGESIMAHVRRLRMERAAKELIRSERTVLDVAIRAGYGSNEAFTRAFQRRFGRVPSEWRSDHLAQIVPLTPKPSKASIDVDVRTFPEVHTLGLRHVGSYVTVNTAFERLLEWCHSNGFSGTPELYGAYPDDPAITETDYLRSDVCIASSGLSASDEIRAVVLPAGRYAVTVHRGSFDTLHETYLELLGHWLPTSGLSATDTPVIERYLDDPDTCAPEAFRTEVRIELESTGG